MQAIMQQIHRANLKAMLLSRINLVVMIVNCVAMIMLVVTWSVSMAKEGGGFLARYAACFISFFLIGLVTILSVFIYRLQPRLLLYYAHEALSILTLMITAVAMGMNDVLVDLCSTNRQLSSTQCSSHIAELIAELLVCLSMAFNYASTQQRVVSFIDKGILDGIKGRSSGMTQLP